MAIEFKVGASDAGEKALDYLQRHIAAAPRAYLNQLFRKKKVLCSGTPVHGETLLNAGDTLVLPDSLRLQELVSLSRQQPVLPQILFENDEILIADKPAGLAVHASAGHEVTNLTSVLQAQAVESGARYKIAPVQRLDLETSGACLFGKGRKALGELGQLLMNRQLKKSYLALVGGTYNGPAELVSKVRAKGKIKEARCRVTHLDSTQTASLLEIDLLTGRQHQIRQQLAQLGHPLFGDRRYHGPCPPTLSRIFLHSYKLAFPSPFGGEPVAVTAPLPEELTVFLHEAGLVLSK